MNARSFVPADEIRAAFSEAMSSMYRTEVPQYGMLLEIVAEVNSQVLQGANCDPDAIGMNDEVRLGSERHGAIRVGTADELSMMRRVFAIMGMFPVDYYDLAVAGVPVHATAFRPLELASLNANPFRVFTSLLRLDLIADDKLRETAGKLLSRRKIFTDAAIALVEKHESEGGLGQENANLFVAEVLETFRWHSNALIDEQTYDKLHDSHRLIADVVSFKGPHINHLTPRTLDIDAAQVEMGKRGLDAKSVIEGPPFRKVPILLRQTSFKAMEEQVNFVEADGLKVGRHTARFGEIEQRGVALTPAGRDLYDELLNDARGVDGAQNVLYEDRLDHAFSRFPDDLGELREQGLAFFRYELANSALASELTDQEASDLETLVRVGAVRAEPITYEDFLPISAAGIFQSNLGGAEQKSYSPADDKALFEAALGASVIDPMKLYSAITERSLSALWNEIAQARQVA